MSLPPLRPAQLLALQPGARVARQLLRRVEMGRVSRITAAMIVVTWQGGDVVGYWRSTGRRPTVPGEVLRVEPSSRLWFADLHEHLQAELGRHGATPVERASLATELVTRDAPAYDLLHGSASAQLSPLAAATILVAHVLRQRVHRVMEREPAPATAPVPDWALEVAGGGQ